jgi:hypothetical protein
MVEQRFKVDNLDIDRLLEVWRWLCPEQMTLVARNAFGDLFLRDQLGKLFWLDVELGKLTKVADSEARFRELAETRDKREEWFAETDERFAATRGLKPNANECIGNTELLSLRGNRSSDTQFISNLYEHASFRGHIIHAFSRLPDEQKIRL